MLNKCNEKCTVNLMLHLLIVFLSQQVHEVYKIYIFSLFLGYLLQFENPALLVSPLLSLVTALMLTKCLQVIRMVFLSFLRLNLNYYIFLGFTFLFNNFFSLQLNMKKGTFIAKIMKVIHFYVVCVLTVAMNIIMKVSYSLLDIQ